MIQLEKKYNEQPKLSASFQKKKMQAELLKLKSCLTKHLSWDTWLSDTSKSIAHPANAEVGTVHYQ